MNSDGATLELDAGTIEVLEHLARAWGISREEAVRRAVTQAEAASKTTPRLARLEAFKELQRRLQLTPEKAAVWAASVREGRR